AQHGLQLQRALRLQLTLRLLQGQRVQGDRLRRAVEVQREVRGLAGSAARDIARGVETLGIALGIELARAGPWLADQVSRQWQAAPLDRQLAAQRFRVQLQRAAGVEPARDLRRAHGELLQCQRLAVVAEARAQRLQQHAVLVEVQRAVEFATVAVAVALHGQRQRFQCAVAQPWFRIEAWWTQRGLPVVVAVLA